MTHIFPGNDEQAASVVLRQNVSWWVPKLGYLTSVRVVDKGRVSVLVDDKFFAMTSRFEGTSCRITFEPPLLLQAVDNNVELFSPHDCCVEWTWREVESAI